MDQLARQAALVTALLGNAEERTTGTPQPPRDLWVMLARTIFLDEDSHRDADEAQCEVPRPTRPNKDNATLVVGAGRAGGREAVRLFTTTPLAPRLANRKSWWPIHTSCKSR